MIIFSYNHHLSYLVYLPVFESAQPKSEQVLFKLEILNFSLPRLP